MSVIFDPQQIFFGLAVGSVYSLIALGFSMTWRSVGLLNLAHQEFMMLGTLIGYVVTTSISTNLFVAVLLTGLATAIVALLVNAIGLERIYRFRGMEFNAVIATIGWGMILTNLAMLIWGSEAVAFPTVTSLPNLRLANLLVNGKVLFSLLTGIAAMAGLQLFLTRSRLGQAMRAAAEDPEVAELMGIYPATVRALAIGLSGLLGGMAGVLVGSLYYAAFDIGVLGLKSLSAAIIGGFGSIPGAMVGGLLLGVIENSMGLLTDMKYRDFLTYGLIVVILLVRPTGLLGHRKG